MDNRYCASIYEELIECYTLVPNSYDKTVLESIITERAIGVTVLLPTTPKSLVAPGAFINIPKLLSKANNSGEDFNVHDNLILSALLDSYVCIVSTLREAGNIDHELLLTINEKLESIEHFRRKLRTNIAESK